MITRRLIGPVLLATYISLSLTRIVSGQEAASPVSKTRAIKEVRVSSMSGWYEAVSEEGRYRVLFPRQPQIDDDVVSVKGFRCIEPESNWLASYTDFARPVPNDENYLRNAYHGSVEAITKKGNSLLAQRDVFLNGRLGNEFVVGGPALISYLRVFVSGSRMYTLSVNRKKTPGTNGQIPGDVQQFFDSFAYWD